MNFCARCGSPLENSHCPRCGTKIYTADASNFQTKTSLSNLVLRKQRAVFWVIGCCLAIAIAAGVAALLTDTFIINKAGPDSAQSDETILQGNPDKEIGSRFQERGGDVPVEINSSKRKAPLASAADKLPDWVPIYPGAQCTGTFGVQAEESDSGSAAFKTTDSAKSVSAFYESTLQVLGFDIKRKVTQFPGLGTMIMLTAENQDTRQTIHMTSAHAGKITTINLVFVIKKISESSDSDDLSVGKSIMKAQTVPIEETPEQPNPKAKQ